MTSPNTSDLLLPVALLAVVIFGSLGFQTVQVVRDRDGLHQFIGQQDKPLEDSRKLQAQLTALALGTKKLADGGDKNATAIVTRMQQLGITIGGPTTTPGAAPEGGAPEAPAAPAQ